MIEYGKIVRFDSERGFGFITPDGGGADVFLHVSALGRGADVRQLKPSTRVSYEEATGDRGVKAVHVTVLSAVSAEEERWPEYASAGVPGSTLGAQVASWPLDEGQFRELWEEGYGVMLARARLRGWVA